MNGVIIYHYSGYFRVWDEYEENKEQYEMYRPHILAFWKGTMGCTDEEVEWLSDAENWWHSDELTKMCKELKERKIKDAGAEK